MKNLYFSIISVGAASIALAQPNFDPKINPQYITNTVVVPSSPLKTQILFVGSVHNVQTVATYGNPAGSHPAKEWHDFIGFTPDDSETSLGWITVNHEEITTNDNIGDGGGMTAFRVKRDPNNDTLIIMDQTLTDGRTGKFFAIDFVNTVGETGMNCGGIESTFDGRIWTAEEWFQSSNSGIADRDVSDFTIGTGTANGQAAPAGFPGFDGETISKYENLNWMVEVDPREAKAIRKQYNWGRLGWEGGTVLPDNKTVFMGEDGTPGWLVKFVATTAGDFTSGNLYVYKHDGTPSKWVQVDNTDLDKMLDMKQTAIDAEATMFNRVEWVKYSTKTEKVYFTATGRDYPGSAWIGEHLEGAVHNPASMSRAAAQGTHPDSNDYMDMYGRVWELDPTTDEIRVLIEGGPDLSENTPIGAYPDVHLANPDGLGLININDKEYLLICEDLNGRTFGRMPSEIANSTCELYMLDLSITNPDYDDLIRIAVVPAGAEITGATSTPDGKTLLLNSQHPSSSNPFPYNHSLTIALTGWDYVEPVPPVDPVDTTEIVINGVTYYLINGQVYELFNDSTYVPAAVEDVNTVEGDAFQVYPNPTSRMVNLNKVQDVALYDATGSRIRVYREVSTIDIYGYKPGVYFIRNEQGDTKKLIIE